MKKYFLVLVLSFFSFFAFAERPIVRNIQAVPNRGTKINVSWTLPKNPDEPITEILVYRDTKPISSYDFVENLDPIAKLGPELTGYTDSVTDYDNYFYAVIIVTREPYDLVLASINATIEGAHLTIPEQESPKLPEKEEKTYSNDQLRETPLPYIDLVEGINEDSVISDKTVLSTQALSAKTKLTTPLMSLYIFEEDLISPDGGDDYILFEILKTYLVQKKYPQTIEQLNKLAGTNINDSTRKRTYFYIGESLYLLGNYSEAIRYFVRVQHDFPNITQKWIDSALDRL